MARDIALVIDQLLACAPDLGPHLRPMRKSVEAASPKMLQSKFWWLQLSGTLNGVAAMHPKAADLREIFIGGIDRDFSKLTPVVNPVAAGSPTD